MSDNHHSRLSKLIMVFVYIAIIVAIPFFLDYLFDLTTRKKRQETIKQLAFDLSKKTDKPIIVFDSPYNGSVITFEKDGTHIENFDGDIYDIVKEMKDDSAIFIIKNTLEYIDTNKIPLDSLISELERVSGGNIYFINFEKNSPRMFWDYKIKNIFDKPYYLPEDKNITWKSPNGLQKNIQKIYENIFKIIPYNTINTITNKPIMKKTT